MKKINLFRPSTARRIAAATPAMLLFVGAMLMTVSCTKEATPEPGGGQPDSPSTSTGQYISFVAGTPETEAEGTTASLSPETRAGYDDTSGHAIWEPGDCLGVFVKDDYDNKNLCFTQKSGTLSDDGRTVTYEGTLVGTVTGSRTVYAAYPYDTKATNSGTKITTTFPGRQSYSPDGYTGIPLFGKYEGELANLNFETFMNPFAVVELRLSSQEAVKVTKIVFQGNNNETVSGSIKVEMSGARPAVTFATSGTSKSITLDCGAGVELTTTPKSFYIAIPVQEYAKGYRFDVRTDRAGANGVVLQAKSSGVTPVANTICVTPEKTLAAADFQRIIPDAAFRTWLANKGWITVDDATAGAVTIVNTTGTGMNCSKQKISSLDGIEYFPRLTSLICYSNSLTALDVKANTGLIDLDCSSNRLTALDVKANTNLTFLNCAANRLTALDVKANTGLTELNCTTNQLTALDVKANTNLTSLICGYNFLTALDVKANTGLTSLTCNNNQLTELDVTANTNLTELYCYNNQLTELDVTANTNLKTLECYSNSLTALDVKANTGLTSLKCYSNSLTALDVTANTNLTTLYCYFNRLTALDATAMAAPTTYTLYCGNQKDAAGETVTLQLKLKQTHQERWEGTLQSETSNGSVTATFYEP